MRAKKGPIAVGLVAHVDAGKTTLAEAMLYTGGRLRALGRVDHKDAFLDTDIQERARGITIFSKLARLEWKGARIALMDTPGHVDFAGEMERALSVLDMAVLVISGAAGVQAHTLTLWRLLEAYRVPTLLFINKMDQPGADRSALMQSLEKNLSGACVDMEAKDAAERMALASEDALAQYFQTGTVSEDALAALVSQRLLFPCVFGSALKNQNVNALMDAILRFYEEKAYPEAFSARVYKIAREGDARLTFLKITGGCLRVRDVLSGDNGGAWCEKVSGIRLYSGAKFTSCDAVCAGEICAVTGLTRTRAGEGLGAQSAQNAPMLEPVFTYRALAPEGCDPFTLLQKLQILEEEEPQLRVVWNERLREASVQLMGDVQKEILEKRMLDRFGLQVAFGEGGILYRETIESATIGVGHYEPLRHYAEVRLLLEPCERGGGLRFASACSEDVLERSWQRLILTHLAEKRHAGALTGAPIADMKITLLEGRAHLKHTEGGDFRQATYRAVRQGLLSAKSVLLEPWYDLRMEIPAECVGRAMSDIGQMGGAMQPPETVADTVRLTGRAPVSRARYYAREVAAYTRGRGSITLTPGGYEACAEAERIIAQTAYDPERDMDNPADSVFCANGAGFLVPWREAPRRMHIQPGKETARVRPMEAPAAKKRPEEDAEATLAAIFERTYGPVKPQALRPAIKEAPAPPPVEVRPAELEFLFVDGYNIIFAWSELKAAAKDSLESARQSLLDILSNYRGFRPCELTVVFDAYKAPGRASAEETYKNIRVAYTKEGETADSYIEKMAHDLGKSRRVRVATSDGLEQLTVFSGGALRMSASELHADIVAANIEIAKILEKNNRRPGQTRAVDRALREAILRQKQS